MEPKPHEATTSWGCSGSREPDSRAEELLPGMYPDNWSTTHTKMEPPSPQSDQPLHGGVAHPGPPGPPTYHHLAAHGHAHHGTETGDRR